MAKDINKWNVEDEFFWKSEGRAVAYRNLWASIFALTVAFIVWAYWSVVTVQMKKVGYPFSDSDYFSILGISGLTGATLRLPSTFLIRMAGGRNVNFFTTIIMLIPCVMTGFALTSLSTPLWVFQLCAFLSGIGGGNFASSMSNIGFFFPRKEKGLALGLNAGLGNAGVSVVQIVVPIIAMFSFGVVGLELTSGTASIIGKLSAGSPLYISNVGWFAAALVLLSSILAWVRMSNVVTEAVSPGVEGKTASSFSRICLMLFVGFITSAVGVFMFLPVNSTVFHIGHGLNVDPLVVVVIVVIITVLSMRYIPAGVGESVRKQFSILKKRQTWVLCILYVMTFGSFIGFAGAFGLSIQIIFGNQHILDAATGQYNSLPNPNAPSALKYTWLGAFIGSFVRPVGGWIADKIGGSIVTLCVSVVMVISTLFVANTMKEAFHSATPEQYWGVFLTSFLVLFFATGVGNGSVFRTAGVVFEPKEAGPVVGWISAIAAYGAFIIPIIIGKNFKAGHPQDAFYRLAAYYGICTLVVLFVYLRKGSKYRGA